MARKAVDIYSPALYAIKNIQNKGGL